MSLVTKMRWQRAVWWRRSEAPDSYGIYSYDGPVEVKCRWEDKRGTFRTVSGESYNSVAVVYVDRPMKPGDKLKLGEMDSGVPVDPRDDRDAFEIVGFETIPWLKNKPAKTLYKATL